MWPPRARPRTPRRAPSPGAQTRTQPTPAPVLGPRDVLAWDGSWRPRANPTALLLSEHLVDLSLRLIKRRLRIHVVEDRALDRADDRLADLGRPRVLQDEPALPHRLQPDIQEREVPGFGRGVPTRPRLNEADFLQPLGRPGGDEVDELPRLERVFRLAVHHPVVGIGDRRRATWVKLRQQLHPRSAIDGRVDLDGRQGPRVRDEHRDVAGGIVLHRIGRIAWAVLGAADAVLVDYVPPECQGADPRLAVDLAHGLLGIQDAPARLEEQNLEGVRV